MSISTCALREEGDRLLKAQKEGKLYISIHALREEGDVNPTNLAAFADRISIHALREEGDTQTSGSSSINSPFLSTPSARRATILAVHLDDGLDISIHALREEGDLVPNIFPTQFMISIHALREEGDGRRCSLVVVGELISIHALREEGDISCKGG